MQHLMSVGLEAGSCVPVSLCFVRSTLIAKVQNVIKKNKVA